MNRFLKCVNVLVQPKDSRDFYLRLNQYERKDPAKIEEQKIENQIALLEKAYGPMSVTIVDYAFYTKEYQEMDRLGRKIMKELRG